MHSNRQAENTPSSPRSLCALRVYFAVKITACELFLNDKMLIFKQIDAHVFSNSRYLVLLIHRK